MMRLSARSAKMGAPRSLREALRSGSQAHSQTATSGRNADVLTLQRFLGNRATSVLLQSGASLGVQAKLEVSQPADQYEREADRIADTVTRQRDIATASFSRHSA